MSRHHLRWLGGAMMTVAGVALLLLVHATVLSPVTQAHPQVCCQDCQAREEACEISCGALAHDDGNDSYSKCSDDCMTHAWNTCYQYCDWCSTPPPTGNYCVECVTYHTESCGTYLDGEALTCTSTEPVYHERICWQSSAPSATCGY